MNLDLSSIKAARDQVASLTRDLNAQARRIADLNAQIESARKQGDNAKAQTLGQALQAQAKQRDTLAADRIKASAQLQAAADALARRLDPGLMMESLDGGVPIAMLPVRLETRYLDGPQRLAIRIYPDVIHTVRDTAGLTAAERARGEAYWQARFDVRGEDGADAQAQADSRAEAAWRAMVKAQGVPRATWIVRALTPANLAEAGKPGAVPEFAQVDDITAGARATRATALPDRWCAVGLHGGAQVFRVWGGSLPDSLPMAPALDPNLPMPADEDIFGGDRAWLVDFQEAVRVGMGIVVNLADLARGYAFSKGLDRLVVLGVDWTLDAEGSAGVLGGLLQAHAADAGMAFVPLGQPTNNTGRAASGYSSGGGVPPAPVAAEAAQPGKYAAAERLCGALGLAADAVDAPNISGAGLDEAATSMHMINALWRGTFGRYLSVMFNEIFFSAESDAKQDRDLVPDRAVNAARGFAVQHLRPAGPVPAIRIGKQPYGVLPVVAPDAYRADATVDAGVHKVVRDLRSRWKLASGKAPRMLDGKMQTATELLQTGPWSRVMRARGVDQSNKSYATPLFGADPNGMMTEANQQAIKQRWSKELLGLFGVVKPTQGGVEIDGLIVAPNATAMTGVPWVEADPSQPRQDRPPEDALGVDAQGRNFIGAIRDALGLGKGQAKHTLNSYQGGGSLLRMLLAYSAEEEVDKAGLSIVLAADQVSTGKTYGRTAVSLSPVASVGIEPVVQNTMYREITTPREVALLRVPAVTGSDTVQDYVVRAVSAAPVAAAKGPAASAASRFLDPNAVAALPWYLADVARLRQSLDYLAGKRVGELDIALKTTLDAYNYRLDSWYTALAASRLQAVRTAHPTGTYVGGYAWLESLPPPPPPPPPAGRPSTSLGYVHAPSIGQAQAAAILRSGHLANRDDAADSFNIDLSSARARRAVRILQGVGNGQSLAALLGYTLERSLRDALLGYAILPLRLAFPLKATDDPTLAPAEEHLGARDVVDAIKLLDAYAAGGAPAVLARIVAVFGPLSPALTVATLDTYLKELKESWDAVSDVMVSEGVYQVARGNLERAGSALAVLDKQLQPVTPQVTRTPRNGVSYAQRLMVVCREDAASQAWRQAGAQDPRAAAEPRLDAWLATMLGEPDRYAFEARVMRGDAMDAELLRITPAQLGWSPLTLVLACQSSPAAGQGRHSPLRDRIAKALADQVRDADGNTQLMIQAQAGAGVLGLAAFEALAGTLGRMVGGARPLMRRDVVLPADAIDEAQGVQDAGFGEFVGCDLAELEARGDAAVAACADYLDGLAAASAGAPLQAALADGWTYGLVAALPPASPAVSGEPAQDGGSDADQDARRQQALSQGRAQLAAAAALAPGAAEPGAPPPTPAGRVQNAIARIKAVFGKDFPVLPRFTLGAYAADIGKSIGARASLTQGNAAACAGWLTKLARVRGGAERLGAAVTAHDALLGPRALADWQVAQLPFAEDDCWAALPGRWANPDNDPGAPRRGAPTLAWVAHAPGGLGDLDGASLLSGLLVDEWQEFVPSAWQTTALSFHYDAPNSRPPQSLLLAVPPAANLEQWTFANLLATVNEALELAKLRAVRPQDLSDGLGLMLPANFLPENPSPDTPSVRLSEIIKASATLYANSTLALGKQ